MYTIWPQKFYWQQTILFVTGETTTDHNNYDWS